MKKQLIMAIFAGALLASCTNDDFVGIPSSNEITFSGQSYKTTRAAATGADAATLLGNEFRVYGVMEKNGTYSPYFDNYVVKYDVNAEDNDSKYNGWSYQGYISKGTSPATQATRYWDLTAQSFKFVAFAGLDDSKVLNNVESTTLNVSSTNLSKLYASNRIVATSGGDNGSIKFGNTVSFTFKRMLSRIRVGFYETIPGYAVTNVRFYYGDKALSLNTADAVAAGGLRGSFAQSGDYQVTYAADNSPIATLDADVRTVIDKLVFGNVDYKTSAENTIVDNENAPYLDYDPAAAVGSKVSASANEKKIFLSTSSANPTWLGDADNGWVDIFPYPNKSVSDKANNLVLRMDFDLVPLDASQSVLTVYNASAVVPVSWAQWNPNFGYTYIFKITDQIKGSTNPPTAETFEDPNTENPTATPNALTPIVFDAEVSAVEDFNQETITGVTSLGGNAITTYAPNSNIFNAEEYAVGEVIEASSISHGRWRVAYVAASDANAANLTEKWLEDNAEQIAAWQILGGDAEGNKTINDNGVYSATFKAEAVGYYVVELRYLPWNLVDKPGNYVNIYKVIKTRLE